jgi:hypothetical protein
MQRNRHVADTATAALARQARAYAKQTGEPFEVALEVVLKTEAGRRLRELRDESAQQWQEDLPRKRAEERSQARLTAFESFMLAERRELELRKDGQLSRLLGEPLPGEVPAALQRLAYEDRRQAEEGLVALMSEGKVFYKHIEELSEEDLPARIAANRMRQTWLKERQERRLSYQEG